MGYGRYDYEAHEEAVAARAALAPEAVFKGRSCDAAMLPLGLGKRESRDSAAHPASVGIVFALDVSGSMGVIPQSLATQTLPTFMKAVTGVLPDAQVLFMAFGNAYADRSPLQVGQFESEAHLVDHWLEVAHLEGGGGGLGESYDLAMFVAARHTAMDCLERRGKKGYFFMTGDEPPFSELPPATLGRALGPAVAETVPGPILIHDLALELTRSFNCFFLVPDPTRAEGASSWIKIFHERRVVLARPEDAAMVAATLIAIEERLATDPESIARFVATAFADPDAQARVIAAVLPFAAALARGPIAPPEVQGTQPDNGMKG